VVTVAARYWPLERGRIVTSPYGPRAGGFHFGTDFGFPGGSAGRPVYAIDDGTVLYHGAAQGYGGPDPAGWLVVRSPDGQVWEYGHIVRLPHIRTGVTVQAGQQIATINPDQGSNGGTAPHLHLSFMLDGYQPNNKRDPLPVLGGAHDPAVALTKEERPVGWTGDPTWLAEVLKAQQPALKVRELPNWQQYGHGDMRAVTHVMVHHTGNARETAESIQRGRPDLPGPLSQLHIAPDGTVSVVAAGVCWHAGMGSHAGIPTDLANYHTIGIECAWPMDTSITPATQTRERWPDPQIVAMRDTVAAILGRLGYGADRVIAHKEWAGRSQGKWDPGNLDMNWFRAEVAKSLRGDFRPRPVPPPPPPAPPKPKEWPRDATDRELLEDLWRRVFKITPKES
jgi:hypothetical protein